MEAIIIIAWIALVVALAGAGVVSGRDAWERVGGDEAGLSSEGNV
jgi:hypothetical protein